MLRNFYKVPNIENNIKYLLKIYFNINRIPSFINVGFDTEKDIVFESRNYYFSNGYYYFSNLGLDNYVKVYPKTINFSFDKIELHIVKGYKNFCVNKKFFSDYEDSSIFTSFFNYQHTCFNFSAFGLRKFEINSHYNEALLYKHDVLVNDNTDINIKKGFVCLETSDRMYFCDKNSVCNGAKCVAFKMNAFFECSKLKYDKNMNKFYVKRKHLKFFDCENENIVGLDTTGIESLIKYNGFKNIKGEKKTVYVSIENDKLPEVKNFEEAKSFVVSSNRFFYDSKPEVDSSRIIFKLTFKNFNFVEVGNNSIEMINLIKIFYPSSNGIKVRDSEDVIFNYQNLINIEIC